MQRDCEPGWAIWIPIKCKKFPLSTCASRLRFVLFARDFCVFRIKDLTFEIEAAACTAILGGDGVLDWAIDIDAAHSSGTALGSVAPKIGFSRLWHPDGASRTLKKLRWSGVSAYENDDWIGDICVFDEEMFYDSEIQMKRVSSDLFELSWEGVCDVKGGDAYGLHVPFAIQTPLKFGGVISYITQEDAARRALSRYCDEEMFAWMEDPATARALFLPLLVD